MSEDENKEPEVPEVDLEELKKEDSKKEDSKKGKKGRKNKKEQEEIEAKSEVDKLKREQVVAEQRNHDRTCPREPTNGPKHDFLRINKEKGVWQCTSCMYAEG